MPSLRGLAFLLAVCLAGCTARIEEDEGCDDMRQILDGHQSRIEQWGNSQPVKGPWPEKQQKTILQHKPFKTHDGHYCVPVAQSMLLTSNPSATSVGNNYVFRWAFNVGGGGGSQAILIDALNVQQLSLAAENVDVSILCERLDVTAPFVAPNDVTVKAGVSFADGNVSNSRATYTQGFTVAAVGGSLVMPVPFMANAFLIEGSDIDTTSPFVATFTAQSGRAIWRGDRLQAGFYSSAFLELAGDAALLILVNDSANIISGNVQWGLDL